MIFYISNARRSFAPASRLIAHNDSIYHANLFGICLDFAPTPPTLHRYHIAGRTGHLALFATMFHLEHLAHLVNEFRGCILYYRATFAHRLNDQMQHIRNFARGWRHKPRNQESYHTCLGNFAPGFGRQ